MTTRPPSTPRESPDDGPTLTTLCIGLFPEIDHGKADWDNGTTSWLRRAVRAGESEPVMLSIEEGVPQDAVLGFLREMVETFESADRMPAPHDHLARWFREQEGDR